MMPTISPPIAGTTITQGPRLLPSGVASEAESAPWNERLVMNAMSVARRRATHAATSATATARAHTNTVRRSSGVVERELHSGTAGSFRSRPIFEDQARARATCTERSDHLAERPRKNASTNRCDGLQHGEKAN